MPLGVQLFPVRWCFRMLWIKFIRFGQSFALFNCSHFGVQFVQLRVVFKYGFRKKFPPSGILSKSPYRRRFRRLATLGRGISVQQGSGVHLPPRCWNFDVARPATYPCFRVAGHGLESSWQKQQVGRVGMWLVWCFHGSPLAQQRLAFAFRIHSPNSLRAFSSPARVGLVGLSKLDLASV